MSALILSVTKSQADGIAIWVEDGFTSDPDAQIACPLNLSTLPAIVSETTARQHAEELRDQLLNLGAIGDCLKTVFQAPLGTAPQLKFWLRHPTCDSYSWETLFNHNGQFVALESRTSLARQVKRGVDAPNLGLFTPPLKVLAILSAVGVDATGQWDALRRSLQGPLSQGLATLTLLVCQPALQAAILAAGVPGVTVDTMPETPNRLLDRIAETRPHILHFFCHGAIASGVQTLEMATVAEWLVNEGGALSLGIETLQAQPAVKSAWLVMLNCCVGGAVAPTATSPKHSMARQLVQSGAANAVGMTTPIDAADANGVAEAFYTRAMRDLAPLLTGAASPLHLDFAPAVGAARDELHQRVHAGTPFMVWTVPVLYEGVYPLRVDFVAPEPAAAAGGAALDADTLGGLQTRLQLVVQFLRALPDDTPANVRTRALELLEREPAVPRALWPDEFGRLSQEQVFAGVPANA